MCCETRASGSKSKLILFKDFFINHGLYGNTVIFKTWNMLTKLGMM